MHWFIIEMFETIKKKKKIVKPCSQPYPYQTCYLCSHDCLSYMRYLVQIIIHATTCSITNHQVYIALVFIYTANMTIYTASMIIYTASMIIYIFCISLTWLYIYPADAINYMSFGYHCTGHKSLPNVLILNYALHRDINQ